jgi:hypothetical protein
MDLVTILAALSSGLLLVSEALPFIKAQDYNGLVHMIYLMLKRQKVDPATEDDGVVVEESKT